MERKEISIADSRRAVFDQQIHLVKENYSIFKREEERSKVKNFVINRLLNSKVLEWFVDNIENFKNAVIQLDDQGWAQFTKIVASILSNIKRRDEIYAQKASGERSERFASEPLDKMEREIAEFRLIILREMIVGCYIEMAQHAELKLDYSLDAVREKVNGIHDFNQLKKFKNKFLELNDYLDCVLLQRNGDKVLFDVGLEKFKGLFGWIFRSRNLDLIDIKTEKEVLLLKKGIADLFVKNPEELRDFDNIRQYALTKPRVDVPILTNIFNVLRYLVSGENGDAVSDQMVSLSFEKEIYYSLNIKLLKKSIDGLRERKKTPEELLTLASAYLKEVESKDEYENERNINTCKLLFELDRLDQATINQEDGSLARMAYRSLSQAVQIQLEKNVNSNDRYTLARVINRINEKMKDPEADYELGDFKPLFDGRADWSWGRLALAALLLIAGIGLIAVGILAASATAGVSIPLAAKYGAPLIVAGVSLFAGGIVAGNSARPYGFVATLSRNVNSFYASLDNKVPEKNAPELKRKRSV